MKNYEMKLEIPTLKFNSEYFKCPACGWSTPLLVKGDSAPNTKCENCGHIGMYRVK